MKKCLLFVAVAAAFICGCHKIDFEPETAREEAPQYVSLEDVAKIFAGLPIGVEQMTEVHDAASESSVNGYDEEYLMKDLFQSPGSGVGDVPSKAREYSKPLRDLLVEALSTKADTGEGTQ